MKNDPQGIRILVIQTAFIGDVVLTTAMLRILRKERPGDHIAVIVKPEAAPFLKGHPDIDEVIVFDKHKEHRYGGMLRFIRLNRKKNFQVLLSPHQSHRTSLLAMFSKIPVRYGYESAGFAKLAYNRRLTRRMNEHEIHRLILFLKEGFCPTIGDIYAADTTLSLVESAQSSIKAAGIVQSFGLSRSQSKPMLLAVSSIWPTKRWTPQGFAELAGRLYRRYNDEVLLIGSKSDAQVANQVLGYAKEFLPADVFSHIRNLCGQTDLLTLFSLMKRSRLVVSNDSAPVHFAQAAGVPVVAIFGPTVPALGYAPIAKNSAVAQLDLYCRPCSTHGSKECPLGHFRCMKELTAEMVFEKVESVMAI